MELAIALDALKTREKETLEKAYSLSQEPGEFGFKINDDYISSVGLREAFIRTKVAISESRWLFTDIKMLKGGRTMAETAKEICDLGVRYLNLYALADKEIEPVIRAVEGSETKVLGLTVLSHFDESYCQDHFRRTFAETVRHLAKVAKNRGCHGIILPGTMLGEVADLDLIKCATGIRPLSYKDTRHEQEVTPAQAKAGGADIAVIGSPILKVSDPIAALREILAEVAS